MNPVRKCRDFFSGILPTNQSSSALQLEKAIAQGNTTIITQLANSNLLSKPLPNGELPLNYADRLSQMQSAQTLLKLGADPTQCDDQELSAVSTAYFKGDKKILNELIQHVSKDLEIGREIRGESIPSKKTRQTLNSINLLKEQLLKIAAPIYKTSPKVGNPQDVSAIEIFIDNVIFAIFKNGIKNKFDKSTKLHLLILFGDAKMLSQYLSIYGNSAATSNRLNSPDSNGLTPLHYAAAMGRLDLMKLLIEKGATLPTIDPKLKNSAPPSPFALLASHFNQHSPLAITKYDAAMFLCSMALWSAQILPANMTPPRLIQALQLANFSPLLFNFDKFGIALSLISFAGLHASSFSPELNAVSTVISAALTTKLAYQTFKGLRANWRNASLGYGKALLKTAVVHVPKVAITYNQLRNLGEGLGLIRASQPNDISKLNERDIRCLKRSFETDDSAEICFEKSENIYEACTTDYNFHQCANANKEWTDYLKRIDPNTYDFPCKLGNINQADRELECTRQRDNWRDTCNVIDSLFNPHLCATAERSYILSERKGFEPDYNSDFWRKKFKEDNWFYRCYLNPLDKELDCTTKKYDWQKACGSSYYSYEQYFHNPDCIKTENLFREGIKNGFKANKGSSGSHSSGGGFDWDGFWKNFHKTYRGSSGSGSSGSSGSSSKKSSNTNPKTPSKPDETWIFAKTEKNPTQEICRKIAEAATGNPDATLKDVKAVAYKYHPDKNLNNKELSKEVIFEKSKRANALLEKARVCVEKNIMKKK